jgi:hypothetical protein
VGVGVAERAGCARPASVCPRAWRVHAMGADRRSQGHEASGAPALSDGWHIRLAGAAKAVSACGSISSGAYPRRAAHPGVGMAAPTLYRYPTLTGHADGRPESRHRARCSRGSEPIRPPRRGCPSRPTTLWSADPSRGRVRSFSTSRNCTLAHGASLRSCTPSCTGRTVRDSATAGPCVRRRDQGCGSSEPADRPARSDERPCPLAFTGRRGLQVARMRRGAEAWAA